MLIIHTALHAEAKSLISELSLKRRHDISEFSCFENEDIFLIESGIGRVAAATAVGWCHATMSAANSNHSPLAWLNVGIAGHASAELGSLYIANKITDDATGKNFYPSQLDKLDIARTALKSFDQPSTDYKDDFLVDMEASAFFSAANRFSSIELIQCMKIVSDNAAHPAERMTEKQVEQLLQPHTASILLMVEHLLAMQKTFQFEDSNALSILKQQFHFTQYQSGQINRIVQRYETLFEDQPLIENLPPDITSAKACIRWLETRLDVKRLGY